MEDQATVPIPGGGSSAAVPEVDTSLLRDALATLLVSQSSVMRHIAPFLAGTALKDAPRIQLQALLEQFGQLAGDVEYAGQLAREAWERFNELMGGSL